MRVIERQLAQVNRVFDKDPQQFLALRLQYDGQMQWAVEDGFLTTTVMGGSGVAISVDLSQYTITGLAGYLVGLQGYSIPFVDLSENAALSALCLIDSAGDLVSSNGDHLFGFTSILWAYFGTVGSEINRARDQVQEMVEQLSTKTADKEWLDEIASFYDVPRIANESDQLFAPRIINTILRPRGNNIAIASMIEESSNGLRARIQDAVDVATVVQTRNGAITFNGLYKHASGEQQYQYGLFDAIFDVDFFSSENFDGARISSIINSFRDAGTHLRRMSLTGNTTDQMDTSGWQDFVQIVSVLAAVGAGVTRNAIAPTGVATAGAVVSASGATATTVAPTATAGGVAAGTGVGIIPTVIVSAPTAIVAASARFGAAGPAAATTIAPAATVTITPTESANVDLGNFSETYVVAARAHDGTKTRDGSQVYDSGTETFTSSL